MPAWHRVAGCLLGQRLAASFVRPRLRLILMTLTCTALLLPAHGARFEPQGVIPCEAVGMANVTLQREVHALLSGLRSTWHDAEKDLPCRLRHARHLLERGAFDEDGLVEFMDEIDQMLLARRPQAHEVLQVLDAVAASRAARAPILFRVLGTCERSLRGGEHRAAFEALAAVAGSREAGEAHLERILGLCEPWAGRGVDRHLAFALERVAAHPSARRYDLERVLRVAGRIADQSRDAYAKEQTMRALAAVARHPRADRVLAHRVASAMTSIARVARDNITPMSAANALRTVLMRLHADGVVFEEALSLADGLLDPGRHVALQKAATQVLLEIVRSPAAGERLTRRVLQRAVSVIGSLGREAEVKAGAFQTVAYVVGSEWATREAVRTALSLCEGALSSSGCGETVPRWLLRDVSAMLRQVLGTLSAVARSEHCSAADIAWILRVCTQLAVVDEAATKESVAVTLRWLAWNPASGSGVLATILAELEAMRGDRSVRKSVIRSALSEISARLLSPAFPDAPRAQLLAQSFVLDEQLEIWEDTGPLACPAAIDLLRDTPREIQLAAPWLQRYGLPGELVTDISSFVTNEEQEEAERLILRICAEAAAQGSGEVAIALWRGACLPHPRSGAEASRRLAEAIDRPGSLLSVVPWGPAELGEVGDCLAERPPDPQGILAERASAVLRAAAALLRLVPPGDRDPLAPGLARLCASVAATAAGSAAEARFVADFREACAGSGVPVPRLA